MYIIGQEEIDAVARVIKSGNMFRYQDSNNSETDQFEREWSQKIGVPYTLAMTSGTASLICGLAGLGVGPGDEVIVPAYTFISTALAPLAIGAVPVLAEINETMTIDPLDIERKITPRTKAIIPVHMCGLPCDMDAIMQIAAKHKLLVLEDACQADGGSYKGKRLGSIGDAGTFSFNHFKIISAGEGGALVTKDLKTYERALIHHDGGCVFFRNDGHQIGTPLFGGLNFRISEVLSSILRVQLGRLDSILSALRTEKKIMIQECDGIGGSQFAPCNDSSGECAINCIYQFDTESHARDFAQTITDLGISATLPIDTGRHVYSNWDAIMQQRGAHVESRNPFRNHQPQLSFSKDMCPKTLSILARSVYIPLSVTRSEEELRKICTMIKDSTLVNK